MYIPLTCDSLSGIGSYILLTLVQMCRMYMYVYTCRLVCDRQGLIPRPHPIFQRMHEKNDGGGSQVS